MRDHDDLPYIVIERRSAGIAPFLWGALLGVGAALLFAPRSGAETQEEIRRGVRRVREAADDRVEAARSTVSRTRERIDEQLDTMRAQVNTVRDRLDMGATDAPDAVDSSRQASRGTRDQLKGRSPGAKETLDSAAEKMAAAEGQSPAPAREPAPDVVVTEVTEERIEREPDLG